jgi:hypothetical protein
MKIYNSLFIKAVIGLFILLATMVGNCQKVGAQFLTAKGEKMLSALPSNLPLPVKPQRYRITSDYYNRTFQGVFMDKIRVSGDFTTNLPGGTEKWNHVTIAKSAQLTGEYSQAEPQVYFENFTYLPSEKILQPDFFKNFPIEAVQAKNLIWDMAGIEAFAWGHLDSLKLNRTYEAKEMNGPANLAGLGTFKNNNIQLTWKGISRKNGQMCGLIDFRAMDNPLEVSMKMNAKDFIMKGVSHYWGTVYISLTEKKLEYTELVEVVTMEMKWGDQPVQYLYTDRFMTVEKIQ